MLEVLQESVRPLLTYTHSHFGQSCPGWWWSVFGVLYTLFSVKNKCFTLNGAETNGWLCLCQGVKFVSRTKSESKLRRSLLQLASRNRETHWNDSGNPGYKIQNKYEDLSDWNQEIISHQFSLTLAISLRSALMVLGWQLFSLRLLHLVREFKLPALGI